MKKEKIYLNEKVGLTQYDKKKKDSFLEQLESGNYEDKSLVRVEVDERQIEKNNVKLAIKKIEEWQIKSKLEDKFLNTLSREELLKVIMALGFSIEIPEGVLTISQKEEILNKIFKYAEVYLEQKNTIKKLNYLKEENIINISFATKFGQKLSVVVNQYYNKDVDSSDRALFKKEVENLSILLDKLEDALDDLPEDIKKEIESGLITLVDYLLELKKDVDDFRKVNVFSELIKKVVSFIERKDLPKYKKIQSIQIVIQKTLSEFNLRKGEYSLGLLNDLSTFVEKDKNRNRRSRNRKVLNDTKDIFHSLNSKSRSRGKIDYTKSANLHKIRSLRQFENLLHFHAGRLISKRFTKDTIASDIFSKEFTMILKDLFKDKVNIKYLTNLLYYLDLINATKYVKDWNKYLAGSPEFINFVQEETGSPFVPELFARKSEVEKDRIVRAFREYMFVKVLELVEWIINLLKQEKTLYPLAKSVEAINNFKNNIGKEESNDRKIDYLVKKPSVGVKLGDLKEMTEIKKTTTKVGSKKKDLKEKARKETFEKKVEKKKSIKESKELSLGDRFFFDFFEDSIIKSVEDYENLESKEEKEKFKKAKKELVDLYKFFNNKVGLRNVEAEFSNLYTTLEKLSHILNFSMKASVRLEDKIQRLEDRSLLEQHLNKRQKYLYLRSIFNHAKFYIEQNKINRLLVKLRGEVGILKKNMNSWVDEYLSKDLSSMYSDREEIEDVLSKTTQGLMNLEKRMAILAEMYYYLKPLPKGTTRLDVMNEFEKLSSIIKRSMLYFKGYELNHEFAKLVEFIEKGEEVYNTILNKELKEKTKLLLSKLEKSPKVTENTERFLLMLKALLEGDRIEGMAVNDKVYVLNEIEEKLKKLK